MILIWGAARDTALVAVRTALSRMRAPSLFLDQSEVLSSGVDLRVDDHVAGALHCSGTEFDFDALAATYIRTYDWTKLPSIRRAGPGSEQWSHAERFHQIMWLWSDLTAGQVVNRPSLMASNCSKPYQCDIINAFGLRTPATLLTTSPDAARHFRELHGTVVYKSISGVRSIVSKLTPEHDLADVATCPTQFQEYVAGVDHRVHVIGDEIFCVEIVTDADDYRYAHSRGRALELRRVELEAACADACRRVAGALGMPVVGIDLRRTPEGEWCCFEVNPSPAFTFYDRDPDEPVAHAIARLLTCGKEQLAADRRVEDDRRASCRGALASRACWSASASSRR